MLIKLRETLLDVGKSTKVTIPEGLQVYPNNKLWAGLTTFALCALFAGFIILIPTVPVEKKEVQ